MIKELIKRIIPPPIVNHISQRRLRAHLARQTVKNRGRTAAEVFTEIYVTNAWGGKPGELNSGSGTYGPAAEKYVGFVNDFIRRNDVKTVVDLGCGDFAIGQEIKCESYVGVDVVQIVIDRNNQKFGTPNRRFVCIDVAGDEEIPDGDLCLVRQVFQHLSNDQILRVLQKVSKFRHVLITEDQPSEADLMSYNVDKIHGEDTRLYYGSGVYLDRPPFNRPIELLLDCPGKPDAARVHGRGSIRTFSLGG